jgi:hypothetical protein
VEGEGRGLTVSGVSRNRGGFVKCVAIQKRLGIPDLVELQEARTSETVVNFYQTTRRYNPEDSHLRTYRHENLKSYLDELWLPRVNLGQPSQKKKKKTFS